MRSERRGRPQLWAITVAIALVVAATTVAGQRGFRGGYNRGESGIPPRLADAQDFDGSFQFCRLMYRSVRSHDRGLGWGTDYPDAEINFSIRLSELTRTRISRSPQNEPNHFVVRPTDEALFQCPFIIMSDAGSADFNEQEVANLRSYLLKGGFLWADDFWGPDAWDDFAGEMAKLFDPRQYPTRDLPYEHPIFRTMFTVTKVPQVPAWQYWRVNGDTSELGWESREAHLAAITDVDGRVMVMMTHNTDLSDSWEREGQDPQYFLNFSPSGYALGLNVALYSMMH